MNSNLLNYGLTQEFIDKASLYGGLFLGRVTQQHRGMYKVVSEESELDAVVSGKFAHESEDSTEFPTVGDWVMLDRTEGSSGSGVIHNVLPRKTALARMSAGASQTGQMIAANIDTIFLCMSLNDDFNLRRMERYLTMAWDSMAMPVIVLTKADLCDDLSAKLSELAEISFGVEVLVSSAEDESGYKQVESFIEKGKTVAFIGSSGVGKSTLINKLVGEEVLATSSIREDDSKGRHTTTHRQLLVLPSGGIVIDTPGMRELQIYTGNISKTFEDIEEIAANCRFADCSHNTEPGCAVKQAISDGSLSPERFESYLKLQREVSYQGLTARQRENEKINRMFGGKNEMKQALKHIKSKNQRGS